MSTDHFSFKNKPIHRSIYIYMDSSSTDGSSWMQTALKLEQRDVFGKDSATNTLFSKTGSAVCISHKADRS